MGPVKSNKRHMLTVLCLDRPTGVQKAGLLSDFEKKKTTKHASDRSSHDRNDEIATDGCPEEDEGARSPFDFEVAKPGTFDRTIEHLYNICSDLDPLKFPLKDSLPMPTYLPSKDIAATLVEIFKESLPQEVMTRHVLDEQLAAEDLDRALRKAAKEYVKSIKGIGNESNTCAIQEFFARKY
jgi:hypothetical protein